MKNSIKHGLTATVAALALGCTSVAYAAEVVVTAQPAEVAVAAKPVEVVSTTTTAGTISEFSPDTIVVRSETAPEPIRYSYSKTTTYVDEAGAPVSMDVVRSGVPVTVYYQRVGDRMIANKVVVRKKTTTTTTTTTRKVDDDDDDDDRD